MMDYQYKIYRDKLSNDETAYIVMYPDLRGCMAQGETVKAALECAELCKQDWLDHYREHGLQIPEPRFINEPNEILDSDDFEGWK